MPTEKILSVYEAARRLSTDLGIKVNVQALHYQVKIGNIVLKPKKEIRHGIGEWDLPRIKRLIRKNKQDANRYLFQK